MRIRMLAALVALCAGAARADDWLLGARHAADGAAIAGEALPEPPKSGWAPFQPESRLFGCDLPSEGWQVFEEEDAEGLVTRFLGPDEPGGAFRATLSVRFVDRDAPNYVPPRQAVDQMRVPDPALGREATPVRDIRVPAGLARVFEVVETRRLPADNGPSTPIELHAYAAVIPRGDAYYLIRLLSTRPTYLEHREFFSRFLKSFRGIGAR